MNEQECPAIECTAADQTVKIRITACAGGSCESMSVTDFDVLRPGSYRLLRPLLVWANRR